MVSGKDVELVSVAEGSEIWTHGRRVIGEPTGTSTKFAKMMGQAVTSFFEERGVTDLRLTIMPLEGEGTIEHRVDKRVPTGSLRVEC